jgi:hypothetical protein
MSTVYHLLIYTSILMAYNNFTLESVTEQFELRLINQPFCESLPVADLDVEF